MDTTVILRLGQENRFGEIPVTLRLSRGDDRPLVELTATLPSVIAVVQHYEQWQVCYQSLTSVRRRLDAPSQQVSNVSSVEHCLVLAQQLTIALNQWLNTNSFRPIKEALLQYLSVDEPVRVLLQGEDGQLQRLPWHLWDFIQNYRRAEVAISPASYQRPQQAASWQRGVTILAILGDSRGIDTEVDRTMLSQLPDASVRFLVEPSRQDLSDQLWEQGWDILFFAGHSCTQNSVGRFAINATEHLTIDQLRYALRTAIAAGLQLAIFNSCDGLGLAHQLVDLNIPQMIVMREPVPDQVAQAFLKYFLREFSAGESLYQSARIARERLQGLEGEFPCASWLPVIVQNPVAIPPSWQQLVQGNDRRQEPRSNTVTLVFTDLAESTAMKNAMPGRDLATRNQQFFQQVLKPHRQRVEANLSGYRGRVVKTEGDGHFLVFAHAASAVRWVTKLQLSYLYDPIFTPIGTVQIRVG
ncbi:MAG: CHAT domain-containing protein, partial [Cyanobacteria bacterium]|nr:CHAT domain-containing protein [Cyanobacteriota bacterium]MDW8203248.1 CHAT domain-containing protein [Cyanobacteriota bacterium SKYGB_h_bin112]